MSDWETVGNVGMEEEVTFDLSFSPSISNLM